MNTHYKSIGHFLDASENKCCEEGTKFSYENIQNFEMTVCMFFFFFFFAERRLTFLSSVLHLHQLFFSSYNRFEYRGNKNYLLKTRLQLKLQTTIP